MMIVSKFGMGPALKLLFLVFRGNQETRSMTITSLAIELIGPSVASTNTLFQTVGAQFARG